MGNRKPKTLILDIYGAYARQLGGWLAVAELVKLMSELGMDEQAVRSTVSRMTRRGLLVQERRDRVQGYRLSEEGLRILEEGDRRIFTSKEPADLTDGWVLVAFSMPERDRHKRHLLRSRLTWLGFGKLSSGVWIAPRRILPELMETIRVLGFEEHVNVFHAVYRGFSDLKEIVGRSWDLDVMREFYLEFLQECQPFCGDGHRPEPSQKGSLPSSTTPLALTGGESSLTWIPAFHRNFCPRTGRVMPRPTLSLRCVACSRSRRRGTSRALYSAVGLPRCRHRAEVNLRSSRVPCPRRASDGKVLSPDLSLWTRADSTAHGIGEREMSKRLDGLAPNR